MMTSVGFDTNLAIKTLEAQLLISETLRTQERPCLTCSFQAEDMVVVHLVRQFLPEIPVLFLDTGYHFAEVYEYRDRMAAEWNLRLVNLVPKESVVEQERTRGLLYQSAPDQCCGARKVQPLFTALESYGSWFTGLRREQSKSRANLERVEKFALPTGTRLQKVSPLADWTTREVWSYASGNGISLLPLYEKGYVSIGCEPCTSLPDATGDLRSGRWSGKKLECGIHIQPMQQH